MGFVKVTVTDPNFGSKIEAEMTDGQGVEDCHCRISIDDHLHESYATIQISSPAEARRLARNILAWGRRFKARVAEQRTSEEKGDHS